MEIGKVPNDKLKKIVLDKISNKRKEVIVRPKIGEDCCGIDFGDSICVLSSDPITGTGKDIGKLAVHISCNDIASSGIEPIGLIVTILLPPGTSEEQLDYIMEQASETSDQLNIDIMGGHTEITDAVSRPVVISTAIGKAPKDGMVTSSGAKPGDCIIATKSAGIEGTAIIAFEKEKELKAVFGKDFVDKAKGFIKNISVVKEGVIAGKFGVSAMHDVTEGGILGALWEIAEASGVGIVVYKHDIPLEGETCKICEYYGIDALKLISSGCMLVTCADGNGLVNKLLESGINAVIIGKVTDNKRKILIDGEVIKEIAQPGSDELYKIV